MLENYDQKNAFSSARIPHSKLVHVGAEGAFRKLLGSVTKKRISQNSTTRAPLGRQGVKSLRGKSVRQPPPPPPP